MKSLPVAVFALVVGCGQELTWLRVEASIEEVCIGALNSEFPGSPREVEATVMRTVDGSELGVTKDERIDADFYLTGVGLSGGIGDEGTTNFEFIDRARVEISGGGQRPAELLNVEGAPMREGEPWFVSVESAVDIADYVQADDLSLMFEVSGTLPERDWTVDLEICVSGGVTVSQSVGL